MTHNKFKMLLLDIFKHLIPKTLDSYTWQEKIKLFWRVKTIRNLRNISVRSLTFGILIKIMILKKYFFPDLIFLLKNADQMKLLLRWIAVIS